MIDKNKQLLLGAHVSTAGGLFNAYHRAEELSITCMQIFTKNGRQWKAKPLTPEEVKLFLKAKEKSRVAITAAHAGYLINLGAHDEDVGQKSIESLILELARAQTLEIPYLVLHPGSGQTNEETKKCLDRIIQRLNYVIEATQNNCMILLETAAGQGYNVGYTFEQLRTIYQNIENKSRVGFCFDTCHVFASGYEFNTQTKYESLWQKFDELLGIDKLKLIHLNDSQKQCGSRIDRHANIGEGVMGIEPFSLILNDPKLSNIPKIIETPKKTELDDKKNLETLRSLIKKEEGNSQTI